MCSISREEFWLKVRFMPLGLHGTLNLQHVLETWVRLWWKTSAVYHLPLRFLFHSELRFHLHGKGNRPAVGWEIEANSSQVLEFPSGLSLIQHIWASLRFFSLSFATLCSKEVLEQYFTWHIPAFIWNTKKVQFSSNMRRELGNMQRFSKHLVGLEPYRGDRCCSWPCLPPHTKIYGYLCRLVFSLGNETQME